MKAIIFSLLLAATAPSFAQKAPKATFDPITGVLSPNTTKTRYNFTQGNYDLYVQVYKDGLWVTDKDGVTFWKKMGTSNRYAPQNYPLVGQK